MSDQTESFEPDEFHDLAQPGHLGKRLLVVLLIAGALVAWRYARPSQALADQGWIGNWDQAVAQSKSTGKPALVLFTADWCGACRQFESETLRDPQVREFLAANHTLVVVDLSDRSGPNNERAAEFGVRSIPTLVLYNTSGLEAARSHGLGPEELIDWLRRHR